MYPRMPVTSSGRSRQWKVVWEAARTQNRAPTVLFANPPASGACLDDGSSRVKVCTHHGFAYGASPPCYLQRKERVGNDCGGGGTREVHSCTSPSVGRYPIPLH